MAKGYSYIKRYGFVRDFPIFQPLKWLDQHRIALSSEVEEYRKGDIIRKQGDPPDALYCLVSGRVQSFLLDSGGQKMHVDFIRRGMYFGIISLLTGQNHSLTFKALNDSVVLKLDKQHFKEILQNIPQLGLEFSQSLSRRVRRNIVHEEKVCSAGSIISVYSPFKGAGSSTYATHLAFALHCEAKQNVILVNLRSETGQAPPAPQEDVPVTPLWKKEGARLTDVVTSHENIKRHIFHSETVIDMLSVRFDPQDMSLRQHISAFVTELEHDYHCVVVDLPNDMDDIVLKTLGQSDNIHLIVNLDRDENCSLAREIIYRIEEELKGNFSPEKLSVLVSGLSSVDFSLEDINNRIDYDVYAKLPHIDIRDLKEIFDSEYLYVGCPGTDSPYGRFVRKMARRVSGIQVGLVLGGGAAFGLAHIGVLRVLEQEHIPVDMVAGSSMGALIASLWVTGMTADDMTVLAKEFGSQRSLVKLFDPVVPKSGLIGGRLLKNWLKKKHLAEKTFYSSRIPVKIVAYDLERRQEIVIDSGLLVDAVRKSISIPGVMEPVFEKKQVIIDGGVLNPLPTNVLQNCGINKIIAVNVLQSPEDVMKGQALRERQLRKKRLKARLRRNPFRFMTAPLRMNLDAAFHPNISDIIVKSLMASEYVISQSSAELAHVVIHPDLAGTQWFEFYKVDELIRQGELAARAKLAEIRDLCL